MKKEFWQENLAQIINEEVFLPGALITVNEISTDDIGREIKIWVSVLPEKFFGSALKGLRKKSKIISQRFQKKIKMHQIPHLSFAIDSSVVDFDKENREIEKLCSD